MKNFTKFVADPGLSPPATPPRPPPLRHRSATGPGRAAVRAGYGRRRIRCAHARAHEALEEASDALLTREAEAVLAEAGPTVTMAELVAGLFPDPIAPAEPPA
ncbi:hypothetical protein [Streptomyces sp. NPDC051567]|uniref:hypothetical protein n=1 Tax=Streptomyces sp. NPDC051567 TaxID=3365660 RepID=UPI00379864EB